MRRRIGPDPRRGVGPKTHRRGAEITVDRLSLEHHARPPFLDFGIGPLRLARHLGLQPRSDARHTLPIQCVFETTCASTYASQLLLRDPSDFPRDRVPLFVCGCGDLQCGALTVAVTIHGTEVVWADLGRQGPGDASFSQSVYMERTRPFTFDLEAYSAVLLPFVRGRSRQRRSSR